MILYLSGLYLGWGLGFFSSWPSSPTWYCFWIWNLWGIQEFKQKNKRERNCSSFKETFPQNFQLLFFLSLFKTIWFLKRWHHFLILWSMPFNNNYRLSKLSKTQCSFEKFLLVSQNIWKRITTFSSEIFLWDYTYKQYEIIMEVMFKRCSII